MNTPRFLLAAALVALCATARGAEVPFLSGRVNDTAGMLSLETIQRLNDRLKSQEDSSSNQVVVLTVRSLEGDDIESFSIRVVDAWKLGRKGKDNGVLLLIVRDERKVRIEVGRGLEGNLPDITCGSIIRNEIVPRFKSGDFDGGTIAGVEAILAAIQGAYAATEAADGTNDLLGGLIAFVIFLFVVGIFTIIGLVSTGFASWFMYVFLMPFWFVFPTGTIGNVPGTAMFLCYLIGFPALKFWLRNTKPGKALTARAAKGSFFGSLGSGGWSSSGSGSSSSFSGGGGSFSGGGASGSW